MERNLSFLSTMVFIAISFTGIAGIPWTDLQFFRGVVKGHRGIVS